MEESAVNRKLEEILKTLKGVEAKHAENFEKLEKRLMGFEKSIEFINAQFENHKQMTENLLKRNTKLEEENKELKKQIGNLEREVKIVNNEVNDLEQYGRRDCLEISGIPKKEKENAESLVIKLGEKLGIKCEEHHIQACHRNGPREDAAIICKFLNRKSKELFMQKRRELRNITAKDLDLNEAGNLKIFINESLTKKNKHLFKLTRDRKKEAGWDFTWTKNGVIFARKNKDSASVTIRNEQDIEAKIV
eukprot:gene1405-biopygen1156